MTARVTSGETLDTIAGDIVLHATALLVALAEDVRSLHSGDRHVTTVEDVQEWLDSGEVSERLADVVGRVLRGHVGEDRYARAEWGIGLKVNRGWLAFPSEAEARQYHQDYPDTTTLVTRTVSVSPWRDASPEGAS